MLSQVAGTGSEFQIHLMGRENGRDRMVIKVERGQDAGPADDRQLAERIATEVRRKVLVRSDVELVAHGSLPRTQRKSRRVFDHRNGDGGSA